MYKALKHSIVIAALFGGGFIATAEGVVASQEAERQITTLNQEGKKVISFEPAEMVAPGDVVRFSIKYENQQDLPAENIVLVMPIPETMVFMDHNKLSPGQIVLLSYDGAKNFLPMGQYPSAYDEDTMPVTHVRWQFRDPIKARSEGKVSATARLR